jgi:hypothetical protein
MPLRAAFVATPASVFLTKIGVTGIAGIGDSDVGGSDRLFVAGLHCRYELHSRGLHCRDQSIDTVARGEDRGFDFAVRHIRARNKQAPVESAGEIMTGIRIGTGVALLATIAAEMLAGQSDLGFLLYDAAFSLRPPGNVCDNGDDRRARAAT